MMHRFPELTIGGVLIAPFVTLRSRRLRDLRLAASLSPPHRFRSRLQQPASRGAEPLRPDPRAADRAVLEGGILAIVGTHRTRAERAPTSPSPIRLRSSPSRSGAPPRRRSTRLAPSKGVRRSRTRSRAYPSTQQSSLKRAAPRRPGRIARFVPGNVEDRGDHAHRRPRRYWPRWSSGTSMSPRPGPGMGAFACSRGRRASGVWADHGNPGRRQSISFVKATCSTSSIRSIFKVSLDTSQSAAASGRRRSAGQAAAGGAAAAPFRSRHDTGGAAAIRRQRHPGAGDLRRRPAAGRTGPTSTSSARRCAVR